MKGILHIASLMLIVTRTIASQVWLEPANNLPTINIEEGHYVSHCVSSDNSLFIFVTIFELLVYKVKGNSVRMLNRVDHQGLDLTQGVISLYSSNSMFGIITPKDLFLINILDAETYTTGTKRGYPSTYFGGLDRFTSRVTNNYWHSEVIMKSGTNELTILDLSQIKRPKYRKLVPMTYKGSAEISQMQILSNGRKVVILYSDYSLYGVDLKTGVSEAFSDTVIRAYSIRYDYVTSTLLVVDDTKLQIFSSATGHLLATLILANDLLDPKNMRARETGVNIMQFSGSHLVHFLDTKTMSFLDETININEAAGYNAFIDRTFRHSSLVLVNTPMEKINLYKFYRLKATGMPKFCHRTCGDDCLDPFVVCKDYRLVFVSFAAAFASMAILFMTFIYYCNRCERKLNENTRDRTKSFSKAIESLLQDIDEKDIDRGNMKFTVSRRKTSQALVNSLLDSSSLVSVKDSLPF